MKNNVLKAVSILMMIGGAGGLIAGTGGILLLTGLIPESGIGSRIGLFLLSGALALVGSLVSLVAGILGIKYSGRPEKLSVCLAFGLASLLLSLAGAALSVYIEEAFDLLDLAAALILPLIYLWAVNRGRREEQEVI